MLIITMAAARQRTIDGHADDGAGLSDTPGRKDTHPVNLSRLGSAMTWVLGVFRLVHSQSDPVISSKGDS